MAWRVVPVKQFSSFPHQIHPQLQIPPLRYRPIRRGCPFGLLHRQPHRWMVKTQGHNLPVRIHDLDLGVHFELPTKQQQLYQGQQNSHCVQEKPAAIDPFDCCQISVPAVKPPNRNRLLCRGKVTIGGRVNCLKIAASKSGRASGIPALSMASVALECDNRMKNRLWRFNGEYFHYAPFRVCLKITRGVAPQSKIRQGYFPSSRLSMRPFLGKQRPLEFSHRLLVDLLIVIITTQSRAISSQN